MEALQFASEAGIAPYAPEHFAHLVQDGRVTILGFGSLVSKASAEKSFELFNFRLGTVTGLQRIFNRADWININWGDSRTVTGEVCALAMAHVNNESLRCRVALMDVPYPEGVAGFLHRETTYRILEVPYVDDSGAAGIALACGESDDAEIPALWGSDTWYLKRCSGRISYVGDAVPSAPMPLVPPVGAMPGDPTEWLEMTPPASEAVYTLPAGPWVYPGPGYLRMVYRAHARAGIADNFLDTTLLMDRRTTLRAYLEANPLLRDWVSDPGVRRDRPDDMDEL